MTKNKFSFGDVIYADFGEIPDESHPNHEQAGRRPAVVVSNGDEVRGNYLLTVVPITNSNQNRNPFSIDLSSYDVSHVTGNILINQLRTIDKDARNVKFLVTLTDPELLEELKYSMKLWMGLVE